MVDNSDTETRASQTKSHGVGSSERSSRRGETAKLDRGALLPALLDFRVSNGRALRGSPFFLLQPSLEIFCYDKGRKKTTPLLRIILVYETITVWKVGFRKRRTLGSVPARGRAAEGKLPDSTAEHSSPQSRLSGLLWGKPSKALAPFFMKVIDGSPEWAQRRHSLRISAESTDVADEHSSSEASPGLQHRSPLHLVSTMASFCRAACQTALTSRSMR